MSEPQHSERREDFLLAMYSTMWANIDRHLTFVWQTFTVIGGAVGLAVLFRSDATPGELSVGVTVVIVLACWSLAHCVDAHHWYNRNLHIIRNIERHFLAKSDEELVHHYFAREPRIIHIEQIRVQAALLVTLIVGGLSLHFWEVVRPNFHFGGDFRAEQALPWAVALAGLIALADFRRSADRKLLDLYRRSPGPPVEPPN